MNTLLLTVTFGIWCSLIAHASIQQFINPFLGGPTMSPITTNPSLCHCTMLLMPPVFSVCSSDASYFPFISYSLPRHFLKRVVRKLNSPMPRIDSSIDVVPPPRESFILFRIDPMIVGNLWDGERNERDYGVGRLHWQELVAVLLVVVGNWSYYWDCPVDCWTPIGWRGHWFVGYNIALRLRTFDRLLKKELMMMVMMMIVVAMVSWRRLIHFSVKPLLGSTY